MYIINVYFFQKFGWMSR